MPRWKVVSQRNWLKGLQATFARFSQPQGIITRLSNLMYDQRGGMRTTDGSYVFTSRNNAPQPVDGPILDLTLYAPQGVTPYYLGLQKSQFEQFPLVTGITLTQLQVGGAIATAVRQSNVSTITFTNPHKLSPNSAPKSQLVQAGISDASFNRTLQFSAITILSPTSYSYADPLGAVSATGGTMGTNLAPGTYQYDVTATDGQGGETPGSGLTVTIALTSPNNAIEVSWNAVPQALGYVVYGRQFTGGVWTGALSGPGPAPASIVTNVIFFDLGSTAPDAGVYPPNTTPAINTTSTTVLWKMTAPSYGINQLLATLPGSFSPITGGIPGASPVSGVTVIQPGSGSGVSLTVTSITSSGEQSTYEGPQRGYVNTWSTVTIVLAAAATPPNNFTISGNSQAAFNLSYSNPTVINPTTFTVPLYQTASHSGTGGTLASMGTPTTTETTQQASAQGGISGLTSPLPIMLQFANKIVLLLGNGYPPQEYLDPSAGGSGTIQPVSNTYSGNYTDWQASVAWNEGDIIHDSVSGGLFQAQQTGTSGATRPSFNDTLNALTPEVSPGTVVWTCIAVSATGTPLRGAAVGIVYAGSLWIGNTSPSTTSDQLDGPCAIRMSDVNNLESWNPSNVAFLARDDGDQITAFATFTIAESGIAPTGSMVAFKNFTTFQITGVFGANDFSIQDAQSDMGCVAGRTVQFSPGFGITRLTHLGFAYFNGVNDRLISEEIRPYLFGSALYPDILPLDWGYAYLSKGAQAANPPLYLAACPIARVTLTGVTFSGTGSYSLYVRVIQYVMNTAGTYDEVAGTAETVVNYSNVPQVGVVTPAAVAGVKYRIFAGYAAGAQNQYLEAATFNGVYGLATFTPGFTSFGTVGLTRLFCYDLVMKQWAIVDLPFDVSALRQIRYPGTQPVTVAGGASDSSLRRLFAGDETWDTGDPINWSLTGAEIYQDGGTAKVYYRRVVIRGEGNVTGQVTVSVNLQGAIGVTVTRTPKVLKGNEWELRVTIKQDAENANLVLAGTGPSQVVVQSVDWHVSPKPSGIPPSIQG